MDAPRRSRPLPLTLSAILVAVQGVTLVVLAGLAFAGVGGDDSSGSGAASAVGIFLGAYGLGLLAAAWGLWQVNGWARGPILITQLVQLGIAWNLRDMPLLALGLTVVAVATLALVLVPSSRLALEREGRPEDPDSV
ncbi:hypothetical protein [Nocardioides sp. GXZ039]|uniref:hypothetical protein n=1 Tax=Nocardioides sp. GXZ039 TaxID=3136018 RepID=UPI0030F40A05